MKGTNTFFDSQLPLPQVNLTCLPLFHSRDGLDLRSTLENGIILPEDCDVFPLEKLTYLFYGRPAYKALKQRNSSFGFALPIIYILKAEAIPELRRIFPFDSGGFPFYKDFLHHKMKLDQFEMKPEIATVHKAVNYFFETNENYYSGIPKETISYDPSCSTIECFYKLIKSGHLQETDDRRATVEIQVNHPIVLKDALEAIVLPSNLAASPIVEEIVIKQIGAEVITIPQYYALKSDYYYVCILEAVRSYLNQKKLLNACC